MKSSRQHDISILSTVVRRKDDIDNTGMLLRREFKGDLFELPEKDNPDLIMLGRLMATVEHCQATDKVLADNDKAIAEKLDKIFTELSAIKEIKDIVESHTTRLDDLSTAITVKKIAASIPILAGLSVFFATIAGGIFWLYKHIH